MNVSQQENEQPTGKRQAHSEDEEEEEEEDIRPMEPTQQRAPLEKEEDVQPTESHLEKDQVEVQPNEPEPLREKPEEPARDVIGKSTSQKNLETISMTFNHVDMHSRGRRGSSVASILTVYL